MPLDIGAVRAFLSDLGRNNDRDWFVANKDRYEADLKAPALALLETVAPKIAAASGHPVKTKLFRAQRDVRFSKDKTPYHLHLHMLWTIEGGGRQSPGYFFGISGDYASFGGGLMGFDKAVLDDWRAEIDAHGNDWAELLSGLEIGGFEIREPDLKRVPAPYDKDHPHGDLLRRKGISAWIELPGRDLEGEIEANATRLWPLQERLLALV